MQARIMIAATAALIIAGCGFTPPRDDSSLGPGGNCSNAPLFFYFGDAFMGVAPKNKCVQVGETYLVVVKTFGRTISINDVEIEPEIAGNNWLNVLNNSDALLLTFTVPSSGVSLGDRKYKVKLDGVGVLDPVVRVVGGTN